MTRRYNKYNIKKSLTKIRKTKIRKTKTKTIKRKKPIKKTYKGGNNTIKCSICNNNTNITDSFAPSKCFQLHMDKAHRICNNCWWNVFSKEGTNHSCPGCNKNLPLTNTKKNNNYDDVIDLT